MKILGKIARNIREGNLIPAMKRLYYIDMGKKDYQNVLAIAGVGRSGTTWLAQVVNHQNKHRVIFEPFHSVAEYPGKTILKNEYIRPDETDQEKIDNLNLVLRGELKSLWLDQCNTAFFPKNRIIKIIWGNLLLKWIKTQHPQIKMLYIIRHPGATLSSQMRSEWPPELEKMIQQDKLKEDYLQEFSKEIRKEKSYLETLAFYWSLNNYIVLKQFNEKDISVVFYENLFLRPQEEMNKIFTFLELPYNKRKAFKELNRPSLMANRLTTIFTDPLETWKKYISNDQYNRINEILSLFDLDYIYEDDKNPIIDFKKHR